MLSYATTRLAAPTLASGTVLLVEDDETLARALARTIRAQGYEVVHVADGDQAVSTVMTRSFDVVLSDLNLPGASGVDLIDVVRAYDPDVPVVLMTGTPSFESAADAVERGVLEYLVKPTSSDELGRTLARACAVHDEAREARRARDVIASPSPSSVRGRCSTIATAKTLRPSSSSRTSRTSLPAVLALPVALPVALPLRATLPEGVAPISVASRFPVTQRPPAVAPTLRAMERREAPVVQDRPARPASQPRAPKSEAVVPSVDAGAFTRALASLTVDLDPMIDGATKQLVGFTARFHSADPDLAGEAAIVRAASQLGRLTELRRRVRELAVAVFAAAPSDALLFVDVDAGELVDGDLYSPAPALAAVAERVVLQVGAESLVTDDLCARASVLRFVGFRLALNARDAGLSVAAIADLSPDYLKLDARLVRGVDVAPSSRRVVAALVSMARALDAIVIAEGVATAEERDVLLSAGCALVQGSLVSRHARALRRGSDAPR